MKTSRSLHSRDGGCLIRLFILLVMFVTLCALAWVLFLPMVVSSVLSSRTGYGVTISSLSVNPFSGKTSVRGIIVQNPSEFPVPDFVNLREFYADMEISSLFSDRLVINKAVVDIAQVSLVKNRVGQTNGVLFKERLTGVKSEDAAKTDTQTKSKEFLIRELDLRLDRLLLVDGTGSKLSMRTLDMEFRQTYTNVTSPVQIAMPIVGKVSSLGGAIGDYAGKLGTQALEAGKKTGEFLKDTGRKAGETLKGIFQSISEKAKKS